MRYVMQDLATDNTMQQVNKKWAPEEKRISDYLASQDQQAEPVVIEPTQPDKGGNGTAKAPEWMVEEKKEAEKNTKAVIASIEEFYRLQEASANELAASGQLKGADFERMVQYIQDRKDKMLLEARRAIVGDPNEFEKIRTELAQDIVKRDDKVSQAAMQRIQEAEPAKQGAVLRKYNGSDEVYGLDSNAHLNEIRKNAAQNELNIQRRQAKVQEEIDKLLMQFRYVEQAQRSFGDQLVNLGLISAGYEKVVQQLADGTEITANTVDVQRLSQKVTGMGTQLFNVNPDDAESLRSMIDGIMNSVDADGKKIRESFATMFPNLDEWMANPEKYKKQMQAFYKSLLDYDQQYYNAIKQSYDNQKKLFETRWNTSGMGQVYADAASQIDLKGRRQRMMGEDQGTNFAQMGGFVNTTTDPEVEASMLRMQQMQDELEMFKQVNEQKKLEGEELLAYQQGLAEKQRAVDEAEMAMQEALMNHINEHISKLQEWTAPIEQFGAEVGDAMGKAVFESESMVEGMQNALKTLARAWGEHTIQIIKELMMQQLKQKMINKAMKKEQTTSEKSMTDVTEQGEMSRENLVESIGSNMVKATAQFGQQKLATKQQQDTQETTQTAHKTIFDVLAGIAGGSAKTIESLGWWGIPLVAVITALLMGLLNTALSALGGGGSN
jgi:hypothetical protein